MRCRHRPGRTAARGWRPWSAATSLSFRWMTSATGIAITTSLPTFSMRTCWQEQPEQVPTLHRRASEWYEQHGSAADAIRHALAAEDFARAADLVELAVPAMRQSRQEATLLGWLKALPDEVVQLPARAQRLYADALLAAASSRALRPDCGTPNGGWTPTADTRGRDRRARRLRWSSWTKRHFAVSRVRSPLPVPDMALALGDVAGTVRYARRALDLVPEDDHLGRGAAAALLGLASWTSGDLEAAHRSYADGMAIAAGRAHL